MLNSKNPTLRWIWFWGIMTIMWAWLAQRTQEAWTFYIVVASFAILVGGLACNWGKSYKRKRGLQKIDVAFYLRTGNPSLSKTLTVGVGTHTIYLIITTEIDVVLNAPDLVFQGDDDNKPSNEGRDYGDMFKKLPTGQVRDQWGNVTDPVNNYPKPLSVGQNWPIGVRITTTGSWRGKLYVQIPVSGETIVHRYLDFIVTADKEDDMPLEQNPVFGTGQPASTTRI